MLTFYVQVVHPYLVFVERNYRISGLGVQQEPVDLFSKLSRVDAACLTLSGTWTAMSAMTLRCSFPC